MLRWQPVSSRPCALTPCLPCLPPAQTKGSTFAKKNHDRLPACSPSPSHPTACLPPCLAPAEKKGSKYVSKKEYDRLAALLAAAPTSESEDQALLDGGSVTGALCCPF